MPFPVSNIRDVCKERGTNIAEIERALKIGNGVIARWEKQKGSPPYDRLMEIAEYLEVPLSRLTGDSKVIDIEQTGDDLTSMQKKAIRMVQEMTDEECSKLIQIFNLIKSPADGGGARK